MKIPITSDYFTWAYQLYLMSHLIEACTTLFDELAYDEMYHAADIHLCIFEESEWCKGEQTEYMEMVAYIENELKSVLK